ncbi:serine/threonine-protein kinase [Tuwongella immobilis]|uniref:Protein kinase domain-containing protein n=1 Tax=Tuwongella immobilis TaxID=692036 RepID=A0A6C2YRQ2_9BACT|nr:serine/threonine-protein kinase [Tuwongella immobilis]VIP03562.1 serine threonine protein kinase : Serine/threonine protein kinase with TPR repeats OS=Koribacter versatilis (strain Ellin345) GN=Acid345_2310 PE=3 SV=1: Pkinase: TPR_10: TPR_10: TPR_12: TPR_1 [Tuwongella immobilis]VTS04492.1 serine threonine protein kinase : Serine/threonine protein kinase with TPR repeats OS=Koribacter versatilis (strain Ellin345) GN=Acid345_2310 PE=3 SV=1: Pkinase: TPR_10: TPR_10: TPR_12: TPR_1 [Tuwongella immo
MSIFPLEQMKDWLVQAEEAIRRGEPIPEVSHESPEVRQQLERLAECLRASPSGFLEPAWRIAEGIPTEPTPEFIGQYRVLDRLGQGGMGIVYRAEHPEPTPRIVAIKRLRDGLVSPEGFARFHRERASLARLNHVSIAMLFETGTSDDGRPYFVMEYINGPNIVEFARSRQLSLPDRIRLVVAAMRGVAHAHARGVIHRDLKPANLLIAEIEGKSIPKVIDFGIAKMIEDAPVMGLTGVHQILGTLEYMSPEQASDGTMLVDARADVYSLGAILYELLTGRTPIPADQLRGKGILQALRIVHESVIVPASVARAENRDSLPFSARELTGDLDAILEKALAHEPDARYQSVTEFADDLERHLAMEPIRAIPVTPRNRVLKWIRRNRVIVLSGVMVFLTFLVGFVSTWVGFRKASQERENARLAANAMKDARDDAVKEKERAQQATQEAEKALELLSETAFFANVRDQAVQQKLSGIGVKIELMLQTISGETPRTRFRLELLLGRTYSNTGKYQQAEPLLLHAHELAQQTWSNERERFTAALVLGEFYLQVRNFPKARQFTEESLVAAKSLGDLQMVSESQFAYANALAGQGQLTESVRLLEEAIETCKRAGTPEPNVVIARSLVMSAPMLAQLNQPKKAEAYAIKGYESYRRMHGMTNPDTLTAGHNLGTLYTVLKRPGDAQRVLEEVLTARRNVLGPQHPETLGTSIILARSYLDLDRIPEAERLYQNALTVGDQAFGKKNPIGGLAAEGLATMYLKQKRYPEAIHSAKRAIEYADEKYGPNDWHAALFRLKYAAAMASQGDLDEAIRTAESVHAIVSKQVGESHPYALTAARTLAEIYRVKGDRTQERIWMQRAEPAQ